MRRTVVALTAETPDLRLGRVIATLPPTAQRALCTIVRREDLALAAGSWRDGQAGCLVANVVAVLAAEAGHPQRRADLTEDGRTLDVRVLDLIPELSSRDLNQLIVGWDEAAVAARCKDDFALRRLLRDALVWAGVEDSSGQGGRAAATAAGPASSAPQH